MPDDLSRYLQEGAWAAEESRRRPKDPAQGTLTGRPDQPVVWVKVTTSTADGEGNYPCHLLVSVGVGWEEQTDPAFVVRDSAATPAALTGGAYYACRLGGANAAGTPLYKVIGRGGSATATAVITVRAADGTPSYSAVAALEFTEADGASLSQPSAGVARVGWLPATDTQAGIVSVGDQTWAGDKTTTYTFGGVLQSASGINPGGGGLFTATYVYGRHPAVELYVAGAGGGAGAGTTAEPLLLGYAVVDNTAAAFITSGLGGTYGGWAYEVGGYDGISRWTTRFVVGRGGSSVASYCYSINSQHGTMSPGTGVVLDGVHGTLGDGSTVTGGIVTAIPGGGATIDGGSY